MVNIHKIPVNSYESNNYKIICDDCFNVMKEIPENSIDLYIADPPYWKVIGEKWDYQWKTEDDYIAWCIPWLQEIYRTLRYGGTFYLFGYFRTLALLIPFLRECGFSLRQQIILNKGMRSVSGRATKNYKLFPNVTESILFLIKDNIPFSRKLLKQYQIKKQISAREINEALGVKSNGGGMWSIYTGKNVCEQFPTAELWEKLQDILNFNYPYCKISQTFNPQMGVTDVWDDIDFYSEKRFHPTQKPQKLLTRLILASSNEGDSIVDPFAGSGSTLLAATRLNRKCIVIEKDQDFYNTIISRIQEEENKLF
ncbi:MAG: site-specific DNA-methyltransferase [Lentisphaerae bacterium]|nr:site-specific DNA-methyltransferase [Lentisphaerota bacterium]